MKTLIAAALCVVGMAGATLAEDAMAPMASDSMAAPMASDMMHTMMTPADMLASCLKNAGMLSGMEAQEAGKKTCNDAVALAMGTPMGTDAMSPMGADAMSADPAAKPAM